MTRRHASGFTLLEVLVALVILSFGMLGVAGLQSNSMRINVDAYSRTQAQLLANDLAERMRANWSNDEASPADYASRFAAAEDDDCEPGTTGPGDDAITADIGCWLREVEVALGPGFAPEVAENETRPEFIDIRLGWRDRTVDDEDECIDQGNRRWDDDTSLCYVVFAWSVLP